MMSSGSLAGWAADWLAGWAADWLVGCLPGCLPATFETVISLIHAKAARSPLVLHEQGFKGVGIPRYECLESVLWTLSGLAWWLVMANYLLSTIWLAS